MAEIIRFKYPSNECTLFVSNYAPETTEDELMKYFQPYGLVHSLRMFDSEESPHTEETTHTSEETSLPAGSSKKNTPAKRNSRFTIVSYYSKQETRNAQQDLDRVSIRGKEIRVRTGNKRVKEESETWKDFELANHFIGYNKWCSSIKGIERKELIKRENGQFFARFTCTVRNELREDGRCFEGTGEGDHEAESQGETLDFAKKKAVTDARKQAFKKMAIILLPSGKTVVHLEGAPLPCLTHTRSDEQSQHKPALNQQTGTPITIKSENMPDVKEEFFHVNKKRRL